MITMALFLDRRASMETRWRSPAQERIGLQADHAGNDTCAAAARVSRVNRAIPEVSAANNLRSLSRAHYPGGPDQVLVGWRVARSRAESLPCPYCLPRSRGRSASTPLLSRPAQASLALRPAKLLTHHTWALSRGSALASFPARALASYQVQPTTSLDGSFPPPVICAVEAHTGSAHIRNYLVKDVCCLTAVSAYTVVHHRDTSGHPNTPDHRK